MTQPFTLNAWYNTDRSGSTLTVNELQNSGVDWLIMAPNVSTNFMTGREEFWTDEQVADIQGQSGTASDVDVALAYLSVGKIEPNRGFWIDEGLGADPDAELTGTEPDWVGGREILYDDNGGSSTGNRLAAYWTDGWEAILKDRIDQFVDDGYGGIFLDDVLTHFNWYHVEGGLFDEVPRVDVGDVAYANVNRAAQASQDMVDLLIEISAYAKQVGGEDFKVVANMDGFLLLSSELYGTQKETDLAAALDAILIESYVTFSQTEAIERVKTDFGDRGVDIFAFEYFDVQTGAPTLEQFQMDMAAKAAEFDISVIALESVAINKSPLTNYVFTDGDDYIYGLLGTDTDMRGGRGDDLLVGFDGNDSLNGNRGDDVLIGGEGGDLLNGSAGSDTASYAFSQGRVAVFLNGNGLANGGDATGDTLQSIENLIGTARSDSLSGNGRDNRIEGGNGNDWLRGLAGDDVIVGGAGADRFVFRSNSDTDTILDFQNDIDQIELVRSNSLLGNLRDTDAILDTFGSQVGSDVHLRFNSETLLIIENVLLGDLYDDLVLV